MKAYTPHSKYEEKFYSALREYPELFRTVQTEYRFAEGRQFRFDFAWPEVRISVEIEGGSYMARRNPTTGKMMVGGRHNTDADREKYNLAAALNWRVFRFSSTQLKHPRQCVAEVLAAVRAAGRKLTAQAELF